MNTEEYAAYCQDIADRCNEGDPSAESVACPQDCEVLG
jgi:hypothetical protein